MVIPKTKRKVKGEYRSRGGEKASSTTGAWSGGAKFRTVMEIEARVVLEMDIVIWIVKEVEMKAGTEPETEMEV